MPLSSPTPAPAPVPTQSSPVSSPAPRKSRAQLIVGLLMGLIVGAGLALAGILVLLGSSIGKNFLMNYYYTSAVSQVSTTPVSVAPIQASTQVNIPVPKKFAGENYYKALNSLSNTFNLLATTTTSLGNSLMAINTKAISGNYAGMFDLVYQAKSLITDGRKQLVQFHVALADANSASATITDAQTKSLNQELVTRGQSIEAAFESEFALVDELLSGTAPTSAQVDAVIAQTSTLESQAQSFVGKVQELAAYFAANK